MRMREHLLFGRKVGRDRASGLLATGQPFLPRSDMEFAVICTLTLDYGSLCYGVLGWRLCLQLEDENAASTDKVRLA